MDGTTSGAGRSTLVVARIAGAFVAGFIGVALFHQGSGWLLNVIGIYPVVQYKMQSLPPFGVPQVLSQCFWGGLWGIVLAWTLAHWRNVNYWLLAFAFGLIVPPLVGWFVVPLIKGTPIMGEPPWGDPGDTSAANRPVGRRHSMATHTPSGESHLAALRCGGDLSDLSGIM
jgi:hypothetical protein